MKNLKLGFIVFLFTVLVTGTALACAPQFDSVTLCHATGSESNPYVEITVNSQGELNGHQGHEGDIIPKPENGCPGGEEITPTPTEEPTVTPTPVECEKDCEEVTPTPTPEQPKVEQPKGDDRGDYHQSAVEAPKAPQCNIPFEVARTWYDKGKLHWATDADGIQKFSITYGSSKDKLVYGIDNIPATAREIDKPKSNFKQTWFSVWTWVDNCANQSTPIDP